MTGLDDSNVMVHEAENRPRNGADTLALNEQAGFVDLSVRYRSVWHLVDNRIVGCIKADTA